MLKREEITKERIEFLINEAKRFGHFEALTHEERDANRKQFFRGRCLDQGVWVFGYGSLIWNPAFRYSEMKPAHIHGYHRQFCLHLTIGRGSPENPGLMLALDRGGSCRGIAFKITAEDVESETEILWMREMISGAYEPRWTRMRTEDDILDGFTFVVNRSHDRYRGNTSFEDSVSALRRGKGYLGTCRDYLLNTVQYLDKIGIHDRYLYHLNSEVNPANTG